MEALAEPAAPLQQRKSAFEEQLESQHGAMFTRPVLDGAEVMKTLRQNTPKVDVTQQEGFFCHIKARALVDMPPDVVYDVLTHPDNHVIFRSQKECAYRNVLSEKGDLMEVEVEHTATWNFMFLSGVFHTRTIVYQTKSGGTVQYTMTRPSPVLKRFKGSWTLDPCTNPKDPSSPLWTLMTLDQDMHPNMIPPPPTDRLLRKMLGGQIKAMFDDMLTEFAAIKAGQPQLTYPPDPYKLINSEPLEPGTPPPPPERASSLLAPSSPLPPTPPNSLATPSLPSTTPSLPSTTSSSSSPRTPPTPARAHPARPLTTPGHLPAADAAAAATALAAAIPAVARLAPNLTAHSIDISDSDLESSDFDFESDDTASTSHTSTSTTSRAVPTPHPTHMGLLSDSLQSFYSCTSSDLDTPTAPTPTGLAASTRSLWNRLSDQGKGSKAGAAGGYRYGSVLLQELGDLVWYLWYKLPDTGVLGFTSKVVQMAAAGVLTRVLGPSGADVFVSWDSMTEEQVDATPAAVAAAW